MEDLVSHDLITALQKNGGVADLLGEKTSLGLHQWVWHEFLAFLLGLTGGNSVQQAGLSSASLHRNCSAPSLASLPQDRFEEVEEVQVRLSGLSVRVLQANEAWQDRLLDEASLLTAAKVRESKDPYGMMLWPSATVVAQAVAAWAERHQEPGGEPLRVLELGAGCGLPTLTAAKLGLQAVATDFREPPLQLLRESARRQGLEVHTEILDLRDHETSPLPPADLVVASDLLYGAQSATALAHRVAEARARGSRVIIGDIGRPWCGPFLKQLQQLLPAEEASAAHFVNRKGFVKQGIKAKGRGRIEKHRVVSDEKIAINLLELPPPPVTSDSLRDVLLLYPPRHRRRANHAS